MTPANLPETMVQPDAPQPDSSHIAALVPAIVRERLLMNKPLLPGIIEQREALVARIRVDTPGQAELRKILQSIGEPEVILVIFNHLFGTIINHLARVGAVITDLSLDGLTVLFPLETSTQAGLIHQALVSIEDAISDVAEKSPPGYPDIHWQPAAGLGTSRLALMTLQSATVDRSSLIVEGEAFSQAEAALARAEAQQVVVHRDVLKKLGSAPTGQWIKNQYFVPEDGFKQNMVGRILRATGDDDAIARRNRLSLSRSQQEILSQYVDPALSAQSPWRQLLENGHAAQNLTCLHLHIADMSLLNETGLKHWQNVLDKSLPIVERYGGLVEQIRNCNTDQGEIRVVFGLSGDKTDVESRATSCALALQRALQSLEVQTRIGISTSKGVVGIIGSTYYRHLVAIAEAALESNALVNQAQDYEVLVVPAIQRATREEFIWRQVEETTHFALAGEVTLGTGLTTRIQVTKQPPLIGREEAIQALRNLVEAAHSGYPQLAIIHGETGSGRSALIDALIREWLKRNGNGFISIGPSYIPAAPYSLWFPIWQALFELYPEATPDDNMAHLAEALGRLLPEFEGGAELFANVMGLVVDPPPEVSGLGPEARQQRILDASATLFKQLAEMTPILLVFEHIENTDALSITLVERLLARLTNTRILVCIEDRHNKLHSLQKRFPDATVIAAKPLDSFASWQLLEHFLPDVEWPYGYEHAVEARIGPRRGEESSTDIAVSPAYVSALAAVLSNRALKRQANNWIFDADYSPQNLPYDLVEATTTLLHRVLSKSEAQIAMRASVTGLLFYHHAPWLKTQSTLVDASLEIGRLRSLYVVEPYIDLGHTRRWERFRQDIVRQTVYQELDATSRITLHTMVADWLQEHRPGGAGMSEIGFHAQFAGQINKAVEAYLNACEHGIAWGAESEASQNLIAAERLLSRQETPRALTSLTQVYLTRGQLHLYHKEAERSLDNAQRALELAEQAEAPDLQATALLLRAQAFHLLHDYEAVQRDAEAAGKLIEQTNNRKEVVRARWLQARALFLVGEHRQSARLLMRTIASESVQDHATRIEMGLDIARILLNNYERDRAAEYVLQLRKQAKQIGDPVILHEVLSLVGHMHLLYGQAEEAIDTLERALSLPPPPDAGLGRLGSLLTDHGTALCYLGRYIDAEASFDTALGYFIATDDTPATVKTRLIRANELFFDRNDLSEVQRALDDVYAHTDDLERGLLTLANLTQAAVFTRQERFDEAETAIQDAYQVDDISIRHWYAPLGYVREAELALAQGDVDIAVQAATSSLGAVGINGDLTQLTVAYCLFAEAMIMRGDKSDIIEDALERAVLSGRQQGRRLHLGRALYLLGHYLRHKSRRYSSNRARASAFLFEANQLFKEMDLPLREQIPAYILSLWKQTD